MSMDKNKDIDMGSYLSLDWDLYPSAVLSAS